MISAGDHRPAHCGEHPPDDLRNPVRRRQIFHLREIIDADKTRACLRRSEHGGVSGSVLGGRGPGGPGR